MITMNAILGMPDERIRARHRQCSFLLRLKEHPLGGGEQDEAGENHHIAQNVNGIQMRVALEAEQRVPQVTKIESEIVR